MSERLTKFKGLLGKWWMITLLSIAVVLIIIRIILPFVATKVANDYLGSKIPGYVGHLDAVHFAFIRGAYQVEGFYLDKIDTPTKKETPFVSVDMIDLSLEWSALLHGKIVGKLYFETPVINFVREKVTPSEVVKDSTTFKELLDVGMPIDVDRVEIENGSVHYKDMNSSPLVDVAIRNIHVLAENLQNTVNPLVLLPSSVEMDADVYGGHISVDAKLNLLAEVPTFDVQAEVKHLQLPELNNFFKAYGKFTVQSGDFSVYAEVAAKDGGFKGYVKPLMVNLRMLGPDDKDEDPLTKLWEGILDGVAWVFKNKNHDQLATKVPLEGRFDNPRPDIIYTIYEVLKNAFIQALNPSLDYEINIHSVGAEDARSPMEKFKDTMKGRKENADLVKEENKGKDKNGKANKKPVARKGDDKK